MPFPAHLIENNMLFYIAQSISILVAAYMACHDAPAVNHFSDFGAKPEEVKRFHDNNFLLKFTYVFGMSLMILFQEKAFLLNYFLDAVLAGIANGFWIFLIFDPVLNKARQRKFGWDYIGEWDKTGKWLIKRFGKNAGEIKALFCLAVIIGINILYCLI